jgi:hypothetical protein
MIVSQNKNDILEVKFKQWVTTAERLIEDWE